MSAEVKTKRQPVAQHRGVFPAQVHPYSAGAKGGAAGGVVMAAVAEIYGLVSGHGIWYAVNLLAGAVVPSLASASSGLEHFSLAGLLVGTVVHAILSVGLGLLYGILLPMLPGRPLVWGGVVAPLLWTGLVHSGLFVLDPILAARVSWPWFVGSQLAYGLVAGVVVERTARVASRHPNGRASSTDEKKTLSKEHGGEE